jgi:REP element-mobilizing transposase RayT
MADVQNHVSLHLVWATYDRLPIITPEVQKVVVHSIRSSGEELRCPVIAVGGVEDHIHVLVHFATTITIARLVQEFKGCSARVANLQFPDHLLKWQGGYGVFPVTPAQKIRVVQYIQNQYDHHHGGELIPMLEGTLPLGSNRRGTSEELS